MPTIIRGSDLQRGDFVHTSVTRTCVARIKRFEEAAGLNGDPARLMVLEYPSFPTTAFDNDSWTLDESLSIPGGNVYYPTHWNLKYRRRTGEFQ